MGSQHAQTDKVTRPAPKHIKGRLHSRTERAIKDDRVAYIREQIEARVTRAAIRAELGISIGGVGRIILESGIRGHTPLAVATMLKKMRVRRGSIIRELERMDPAVRDGLILDAAMRGTTIARLLTDLAGEQYCAKEESSGE